MRRWHGAFQLAGGEYDKEVCVRKDRAGATMCVACIGEGKRNFSLCGSYYVYGMYLARGKDTFPIVGTTIYVCGVCLARVKDTFSSVGATIYVCGVCLARGKNRGDFLLLTSIILHIIL